jgi:glutamine amidotransferase PdxT
MGLHYERGWRGAFTRAQAPNARFANGSRIVKALCELDDTTPLGTRGTVLGSIYHPELARPAYFVEWDNAKRTARFIAEWKLAACPP